MKLNPNTFSLFGSISKIKALPITGKTGFILRTIPALEAFHTENVYREKLQIIYANIRV